MFSLWLELYLAGSSYTVAHSDTYWHFEQGCNLASKLRQGLVRENVEKKRKCGGGDTCGHPRHGHHTWSLPVPSEDPPAMEPVGRSQFCAGEKMKRENGDISSFPWTLVAQNTPIGRYFFIFREFIFLGKWTCLSSFHICTYVLLIIQLRSWEYIWTYFLFPAIDAVFAVPVNCNYSNWKCLSDSKTPPLIHGIRGTQYLNR